MRNPQTREHYENELLYIESIDPRNPGPTFNDDPECFNRYRLLQSKLALADGFEALSAAILCAEV
jgi:hypothetical protein